MSLIIDSFAGGGGASTGIEIALGRSPDIAVNHDPEAVAMHAANHPNTRHLCGDVWDVDPKAACGDRPVSLAWFSPDTFHSKARGGKPFRDRRKAVKRRALAWVVVRWAKAVRPAVILLENVEEFADWSPLDNNGNRIEARRGFTFRRWVAQLRNTGYVVEWRELRACDYGAPTTRKRLFVIARCDGQPIVWPTATHGPGRALPYRTAAECIDWTIPCPSIFDRKKPLAEKTLRRIARGIERFVLRGDPFIVPVTHAGGDRVHDIREPMRTVTSANRGELGLVVPSFVLPATHGDGAGGPDRRSHSVDEPLRTITTRGAPFHLVAPTLVQTGYGEREGQAPRSLNIEEPLGTVVAGGAKHALVSAFLAKHFGGHEATGSRLTDPIHTITAQDHHSLVTARLERGAKSRSADVRAFLTKFYGTSTGQQATLPLGTVTANGWKYGLVTIHGEQYEIADIGMRMLQPRELFRAQGFPDTYVIERGADGEPLTKTAQIRLCGNSVCPPIAAAIVRANIPREAVVAA